MLRLEVRPPVEIPNNKNYTQLLRDNSDNNFDIVNLGYGASTVKDIYGTIDSFIREFPDYYIINLGVVDASTREVPLWFYRLATKKSLNPFYVFNALFYRNILSKFRRSLVNLRGRRSWISQKRFGKYFELIIKSLVKETNAKIIVLSIMKLTNGVEKAVAQESFRKQRIYNLIMKEITNHYTQIFLDTNKILVSTDYPDGVHFSEAGHKKIAEKLQSIISQNEKY
ncbi:MAG: SGNH/GDSL hydrolase family protein [Melioribacteraceae bacterium]|nr:SGNH/GDSL hydrolase family protein [Melioribacteraceae bacterium]